MYNLLLVEDETFTREGLKKHIDWTSLSIREVRTAANGILALEETEDFAPDILLSDIKMPHMNGIELAREIRTRFPSCRILFLSGYADKEYLMSAITLKADLFIEKPVNPDAVALAVKEITEQLDRLQRTKKEVFSVPYPILPAVQKDILHRLLTFSGSWEDFRRKYDKSYFPWSRTSICHLIYMKFSGENSITSKESFSEEVLSFFEKDGLHPVDDYFHDYYSESYVMLIRNDHPAFLQELMKKFQQHLATNFSLDISIGISAPCPDLTRLKELLYITSCVVEYEYFYHGKRCLVHAPVRFQERPTPENFFRTKTFNLEGMEHIFQQLSIEKYTNVDEIRIQLYEYYTLMMERTMNDHYISWDAFKPLTLNEYIDLIGYGMKAFQILGNNTFDIKIKNAVHFILWNYQNPELSIAMISDQIGLSPNYMCNLFKRQTGSTVNDFLVKVRMDKARILLEKTDLKLYEIAERVGLLDANYFSTLFKKEYGQTPSAYRNHKGERR